MASGKLGRPGGGRNLGRVRTGDFEADREVRHWCHGMVSRTRSQTDPGGAAAEYAGGGVDRRHDGRRDDTGQRLSFKAHERVASVRHETDDVEVGTCGERALAWNQTKEAGSIVRLPPLLVS